jgi:putative aminopeptidase FrvX
MITKLGEGTAIKIMDASAICDYRMVDFMKRKQPIVMRLNGNRKF